MKKLLLLDFINKYSLGGVLENVKWVFNENAKTLYMGATTEDTNADCEITLKNNFNVQSLEMGIRSTNTFKKMIEVLNNDIAIIPSFRGDKVLKLDLTDGATDITYVATDPISIKKFIPANISGDLLLDIPITNEFQDKFLKAKNALSSEALFKIFREKESLKISIGYSNRNTDRINLRVTSKTNITELPENFPLSFNSEYFKQIIINNKESKESELKIFCDEDKFLAVITYNTENFNCKYILYPKFDDYE